MLIRERFDTCKFSDSEQIIVNYIIKAKLELKKMTIRDIAKATFTSPSTLIRIAHKMNFEGWQELKDAYIKEIEYLNKQTENCSIDANYPFDANDDFISIANNLAIIKNQAINDTLSLITNNDIHKAVKIIEDASFIHVYAISNNINLASSFKHNMGRIRKNVILSDNPGEVLYEANLMTKNSCAIIISYSGETDTLCQVAKILKAKKIPFISITSISDNTISSLANCSLRITTRERLHSKIATFTTDNAISYILDVLYSSVFSQNYDKNMELRTEVARIVGKCRSSSSDIINENPSEEEYYLD